MASGYDGVTCHPSGVDVRITGFDWNAARSKGGATLSAPEKRVVDLLAEGKSTPEIAKICGTNRSAIWSMATAVRRKLDPDTKSGEER
jgi:DNA-binding CsgD family transcriptional regulator